MKSHEGSTPFPHAHRSWRHGLLLATLGLGAVAGCGPAMDDVMPEPSTDVMVSADERAPQESTASSSIIAAGAPGIHMTTDLVWRHQTAGQNSTWRMEGTTFINSALLPSLTNLNWKLQATADMDLDGHVDLVWRNPATSKQQVWLMNGEQYKSTVALTPDATDVDEYIAGVADMDGDGHNDLVWRNARTGTNAVWHMNKTTYSRTTLLTSVDAAWQLRGVGDLNGDGHADLVWRNRTSGQNSVWFMNRTTLSSSAALTTVTDLSWSLETVTDFDRNGRADLVWRHLGNGSNTVWFMDGAIMRSSVTLVAAPDLNWRIVGARRGPAQVVRMADAMAARRTFLGAYVTTPSVQNVPAQASPFTSGLGIARYEVRTGSLQPGGGIYLGVTGLDSSGNPRAVLDLALSQAAVEVLYNGVKAVQAGTTLPPVPAASVLPGGIRLSQAASVTNATVRELTEGMQASVQASLQAAGQLGITGGGTVSALAGPAPTQGTAKGTKPVAPVWDANDRSVMAACWGPAVGMGVAVLSCGAAFLSLAGGPVAVGLTWAAALTCVASVGSAAATAPNCMCAAGIAPFGQETWNATQGQGPDSCSCARTTGNSAAWLGKSPRGGDAACASCPTGTTRTVNKQIQCYEGACGTTQDAQSQCGCPQGTTWNGTSCASYTSVTEVVVVRGVYGCNTPYGGIVASNPCNGRTWYQQAGGKDWNLCVVPYTGSGSALVSGPPACTDPTRVLVNSATCNYEFRASNGVRMYGTQGAACSPNAVLDEDVAAPYILDRWSQDSQGYCVCSKN
jgi:hypothetical protein